MLLPQHRQTVTLLPCRIAIQGRALSMTSRQTSLTPEESDLSRRDTVFWKKMTAEQRKKLLDMAKVMFKEEFDD